MAVKNNKLNAQHKKENENNKRVPLRIVCIGDCQIPSI